MTSACEEDSQVSGLIGGEGADLGPLMAVNVRWEAFWRVCCWVLRLVFWERIARGKKGREEHVGDLVGWGVCFRRCQVACGVFLGLLVGLLGCCRGVDSFMYSFFYLFVRSFIRLFHSSMYANIICFFLRLNFHSFALFFLRLYHSVVRSSCIILHWCTDALIRLISRRVLIYSLSMYFIK